MPRARAASMTGAILRASAATRREAPEHQCLSHMSQIRMAVPEMGSAASSRAWSQMPLPLKASTRERRGSRRSAASAAPARVGVSSARYRHQEHMRTIISPGRRAAPGDLQILDDDLLIVVDRKVTAFHNLL